MNLMKKRQNYNLLSPVSWETTNIILEEIIMEKYNYLEVVKEDVLNYIKEKVSFEDFEDRDELEEHLNYVLWTEDSVTGNGSGSYTYNTYESAENLTHNWDLLEEALYEFGEDDINPIKKGEEWCDVTIRCYLLSQAISEVLDEIYN